MIYLNCSKHPLFILPNFSSSTYLDESFRLQMFQEFSLLIRNGRRLLLLLLQSKLGLHRGNRFRGAGCTSLDPGRCKDEASQYHGHRHQRDSRDSSDLNRRTLRPHVCLYKEQRNKLVDIDREIIEIFLRIFK